MQATTTRRAGFGSSFARHPVTQQAANLMATDTCPSFQTTAQDGMGCLDKLQLHSAMLGATRTLSNSSPKAASLNSSLPASVESSPSATTASSDVLNEQQSLSHQIRHLSGSLVTCVHQNELIISLLKRLVNLTETAGGNGPAANSTAITEPMLPTRAGLAAGSRTALNASTSSNTPSSHLLHHMMDEAVAAPQQDTKFINPDAGVVASQSASLYLSAPHDAAAMAQYASQSESLISRRNLQKVASVPTSQCEPADLLMDDQTNQALLMSLASFSTTPASLFLTDHGQQRIFSRRLSAALSVLPKKHGRTLPCVAPLDSIRAVPEVDSVQKKRRIGDGDGEACVSPVDHSGAAQIASDDRDEMGSWQDWLVPRQQAPSVMEKLPRAKHRTLREVRAEIKASSSRPSGAVGRIPLKQYLEVSGPDECRAVRRLGRKLYMAWLEPNTRLGKQDSDRLMACVNRIEHSFPVLADCEDHWKARQVMLQIIDNAIDEHKSCERRNTAMLKADASDVPSRRRGRPKGTTAAAMAQRRQGINTATSCRSENESNDTDADESSASSDSETDA